MGVQLGVIIQLAGLVTLLTGIIFGILEIRRARQARAERAAIDVFSITVQPVYNDAHIVVLDFPTGVSPEHIRSSHELRRATELLMTLYEYWGIMVFYRILPLRTLDILVGGVVRGSWRRLHRYIESERDALDMPAFGEWFQWLAERLEQYPQPEKRVGAHIAFSSWKP
jgi:hypothetical protein